MRSETGLVSAGVKAQLEKLYEPRNKDKGDFPDNIQLLLVKLHGEYKELKTEIEAMDYTPESYERIRLEAADVANFAHMIILACDKAKP
jgi:hypothetical protein